MCIRFKKGHMNINMNIAILASGNGSNAENIINSFRDSSTVNVSLIATNVRGAYVLERAKNLGIPSVYFSKHFWQDGQAIAAFMRQQDISLIVLAGFLAKIPDALIHEWRGRIINIHPSLLPKFGGKGMYGDRVHEAVIAAGEKESGITIHHINDRLDEGQVIAQYRCEVRPDDTPHTLAQRVHDLEYRYYPQVIAMLSEKMKE